MHRRSLLAALVFVAAAASCAPRSVTEPHEAVVVHDSAVGAGLRADVHVPRDAHEAPWLVFLHEQGWPPPDERARVYAALADALQRRGIGVALIGLPPEDAGDVAAAIRDLTRRAPTWGLAERPFVGGDRRGAALAMQIALDPRHPAGLVRGVVAMNGVYGDAAHVGPDVPPVLLLSANDASPLPAQSSRALARALERGGARRVRSYHLANRSASTLTNLSGERNDVGDLVVSFLRDAPPPGGPESSWAVADAWGAKTPLSTEPFWTSDAALVVRRPMDDRLRVQLRRVFGSDGPAPELLPWPGLTYDAIDLGRYLDAHPELGSGDFVEITNARDEKLVVRRDEIDRQQLAIVIGLDDERNLFRLLVTYNVLRSYSWRSEEPRSLLVRPVGAFLHARAEVAGPPRAVTLADFALTAKSFRVVARDPLEPIRTLPTELARPLTNEQGCLQCHSFRGAGARAHHLRATDGTPTGGYALPFEEYPPEVLRRFLYEQEVVAKSFGVRPIPIDRAFADQLLAALAR